MWPDSAYAVPIGSFRVPVVIPDVDPDAAPLVTVCFNAAWLPYVLGCLKQLMLQATWQTTDPDVLNLVQGRAANLMYLFIQGCKLPESGALGGGPDGEDGMWRQDPDNPCLLQFSADGQCWCTVFDASKCNPNPTQPGPTGGTRPAPGASSQDCYTLQANGQINLPYAVYPGDTIEITSADGAGWDGNILDSWNCPDGSPYYFGACVGSGHTSGSDPLPSVSHMRLLVVIDTTYNDGMAGPVTVGGSGPQSALIQVNDNVLSDNAGSYKVCVKLTNNQTSSWTQTWNFALTPGTGFDQVPQRGSPRGTWVPGVGWQSEIVNLTGPNDYEDAAVIQWTVPVGTTVTTLQFSGRYNRPSPIQDTSFYDNSTQHAVSPTPTGDFTSQVFSGSFPSGHNLILVSNYGDPSSPVTGSPENYIFSVTMTGTGTQPPL